MNKKQVIVITAIEVIALYLIIYAIYGIMPFGDKMLYTWDLQAQYSDFYVWYRDAMLGKTDIKYCLIGSFGSGTASFFAYYLASPFNLILLLFDRTSMPVGVWVLTMMKLVAMAVTMTLYLYKRRPSAAASLCGLCYAACGYVVGFGSNLMWLDAMIFLPCVISGLDELIYKGKVVKYSVLLGITLLANFYTGFMVCVFATIYFIVQFVIYPRWKAIWEYIYGSILGGMLSAVLLLPTFYGLQGRGHSSATRWDALFNFAKLYQYRDILWAFAPGHFRKVQLYEINNGSAPLVYVGLLPLLGIILMLFAKHLAMKQKLAYIIMLGMIQVSFNHMNIFTIMHGMDAPQGAPWRYAFLWSFYSILVGYEGLQGGISLIEKLFNGKRLWVSAFFCVVTLLVGTELVCNAKDTWKKGMEFESYAGYHRYLTNVSTYYSAHEQDAKKGLRVRTDISGSRNTNDGYLWNVATTTGYTSTISTQNEKMMHRMTEKGVEYQSLPVVLMGNLDSIVSIPINIKHISNTVINLKKQSLKDGKITITIPYESNWHAWDDWKELEIESSEDGFLMIHTNGADSIKIRYSTRGLGMGSAFTIIAVMMLVVLGRREFKR